MHACRVYLAGPEVFLPDRMTIADNKKAICAHYGFEGCFPIEVEAVPRTINHVDMALSIFEVCVKLMTGCDLIIANMTPFRGVSMDVGTAVEVGFMYSLGKPVFGYSNRAADYRTRVDRELGPLGTEVESFGFVDNLMCEVPVRRSGGSVVRRDVPDEQLFTDLAGFEQCVVQAAALLGVEPLSPHGPRHPAS